MNFERITINSKQMGGVPCIRGLRIPVATVISLVAAGMSEEAILAPYPDLKALKFEVDLFLVPNSAVDQGTSRQFVQNSE